MRPRFRSPEDAGLLARVPEALRAANGIPEPGQAEVRERAADLVSKVLADVLLPGGVRLSPLGAGWSRDIDVYLREWPEPARLGALGWFPLAPLLSRLGSPEEGVWAVVEDGRVLSGLDLHVGPPPDPVSSLIGRCRRRGEVRAREVLEARALLRDGHILPADEPEIRLMARVEAGLGGKALAAWRDGPPLEAPASLPGFALRRRLARVRAALRPRVVVAVSGVDGSGKSTLIRSVSRNLERADVPVGCVWARPGVGVGWLERPVRLLKKLLGHDDSWGSAKIAAGVPAGELTSRRGVTGWTWAMLVILSFLADVRWQHIKGRGVLLYDRHLLDALVHLDFVYGGADLRLHRALVRRLMPKPALAVYLDVPAEVAVSRKPTEPWDIYVGEYVVRRQIEGYEARLDEVEDLHRMDGNAPAEELAVAVTRMLAKA